MVICLWQKLIFGFKCKWLNFNTLWMWQNSPWHLACLWCKSTALLVWLHIYSHSCSISSYSDSYLSYKLRDIWTRYFHLIFFITFNSTMASKQKRKTNDATSTQPSSTQPFLDVKLQLWLVGLKSTFFYPSSSFISPLLFICVGAFTS